MAFWLGLLAKFFALVCVVKSQTYQVKGNPFLQENQADGCDFFQGHWVTDASYPLYNASRDCPFILNEFNCQRNGRPDKDYLKYIWKPSGCDLPRFDGQDFLRRLRGKKILIVGDSLSNNQWQSLICMLHLAVPRSNYTIQRINDISNFTLPEYKFSIAYSRNAFLVDLVIEKIGRVLKLDSIQSGSEWLGYDMLIFNTFHWWLHRGSKQPWDYIQDGNKIQKDMDRLVAFQKGLTTWSKWVDSNVSPNITKVFFQGISPVHYNGAEWNATGKATCRGQTRPLNGSTYPAGSPKAAGIVKEVLGKMSKPVTLLDITTLSQLRIDGHPSIYGGDARGGNDCSHWCLAGVPDTWNHILYAIIISQPDKTI